MANYPTSVSTDANLYIAKNNLSTTLNGAITNSQTTITAASTTNFPTAGLITIDLEAISYTGISGNDFTGCTRGADGTTAASHTNSTAVYHNVVAAHHNVLKDEIIAVESDNLSVNGLVASKAQNILINGGMDWWQRGTTFTGVATGTYTADRWKMVKGGGTPPTITIAKETGATNVDNSSGQSLKLSITAVGASSPTALVQQVLEVPSDYDGRTVSISARVKTTLTGVQLAIQGNANSTSTAHTGGGAFETLTLTVTSGSFGSNLIAKVGYINNVITATGDIYIDSVMLVLGSKPVTFVPKDQEIELAQCQRFYEKSYAIATAPGTSVGNGDEATAGQTATTRTITGLLKFKVSKRVVPTMVVYTTGGTSGSAEWVSVTGTVTSRTVDVAVTNLMGFSLRNTSALEYWVEANWTADSEI